MRPDKAKRQILLGAGLAALAVAGFLLVQKLRCADDPFTCYVDSLGPAPAPAAAAPIYTPPPIDFAAQEANRLAEQQLQETRRLRMELELQRQQQLLRLPPVCRTDCSFGTCTTICN